MFFSLSNIPTSFQEITDKILTKKYNNFVLVYLNVILIYIEDFG